MASKRNYDYLFKLIFIGDCGVNKTGIIVRFADDALTYNIFTIGVDFKMKTIELEGKKIKLQMWDTAGQECFRSITTAYYRGTAGVILVYDVTEETTFNNIPKWIEDVNKHVSEDVQIMILGNKCHMEDKRQVSEEQGASFAAEHGIRFFEVSSKENINIDEAMYTLVPDILEKQVENSSPVTDARENTVTITSPNKQSESCC